MPDLPHSVHRSPFNYADPAYQSAAPTAKSRSRGHCQECGRKLPLEAHHWSLTYPPAGTTTADDLTGLCRDCHDGASEKRFYLAAGGSPETLRAVQSENIATLLRPVDDGRRVGWVVGVKDAWAASVIGESKPTVGDIFWLFQSSSHEWVTVAVTHVLYAPPPDTGSSARSSSATRRCGCRPPTAAACRRRLTPPRSRPSRSCSPRRPPGTAQARAAPSPCREMGGVSGPLSLPCSWDPA